MSGDLRRWLKRSPLFPAFRIAGDLARGGDARQSRLLMLLRPRGLFQPYGTTQAERYPEFFAHAQRFLEGRTNVRLLSFGCSTGEEVFALAALFPEAAVRGIDIAGARIRACRRRWRREGRPARIDFIRANSVAAEVAESYDAVFAMAVFRHGGLGTAPPTCLPLFDPRAAERALTDLSRVLKPGGLLAIRHANLRFGDLPLAVAFEPVYLCPTAASGPIRSPIYGLDGRLRPGIAGDDGLYRKKTV